jgi:ribonuclease VapC
VKTTGCQLIILDASVLLALAFLEPGWDAVPWGKDDLCVCAVSMVEVVTKLMDRWPTGVDIQSFIDPLSLTIMPLTDKQALIAGMLRASTRSKRLAGLVLGVELRLIR